MTPRRRTDADQPFGTEPAPHARRAFGGAGTLPWWAGTPMRLLLVLALLGILIFVISGQHGAGASSSEQPRSPDARRYCASTPPALARVSVAQFQALSEGLAAVVSEVGGREYAAGVVPASAIWSDDGPSQVWRPDAADGLLPGGVETRRWAPDPQWGASFKDDIVGDVFLFAEPRQASRFFDEASAVRCHRAATALSISRPTGARDLIWVNPDGVTQEDALVLLGRRVYRISDVRPQRTGVAPSLAEQRRGVVTVDAVACLIPGATCPRTTPGV
jgi:hypothetical protein